MEVKETLRRFQFNNKEDIFNVIEKGNENEKEKGKEICIDKTNKNK